MAGIAFTYDVTTPVGQARFYAGDTDSAGLNRTGGSRTRTDTEIEFLLAQNGGDARAAAAELLEARAAEYAQEATRTDQGQLSQDLTARGSQCLAAAQALRASVTAPLLQATSEPRFSSGAAEGTPGTMDVW